MTTFGDQLYQYGGVPVLSGMLTQGKVYHVNPYMGSAGNSGLQATEALKTVQSAHDLCTNATYNYDNDTVLLYANHTTGTSAFISSPIPNTAGGKALAVT